MKKKNMCYSYVMGIDDSVNKLREMDFWVEEDNEDFTITFSKDKSDVFEDFILENLSPGFWNEYIGDDVVFLFKFEDSTVKRLVWNEDNDEIILKLCRDFAGVDFESVENMLKDNEFYSDKL